MNHQPVLFNEAVTALQIKPQGIYVDATFGRGGHSRLILSRLDQAGRLIVCDQDQAAVIAAQNLQAEDQRITVIHDNFSHLDTRLKDLGLWGRVDGILFDLGVSSPQLDEAARGFSFLQPGPLDMRMNQTQGLPLSEKIKTLDLKQLAAILHEYGEERFAAKISRAILAESLSTTAELADLISRVIPRKFHELHKHPATRTFQALRIWINAELDALERTLLFFPDLLAMEGQAVFISFHSLEDRLVKERIRVLARPPQPVRGLPVPAEKEPLPLVRVTVKMQKPGAAEIAGNPRARSAVLRAFARIR